MSRDKESSRGFQAVGEFTHQGNAAKGRNLQHRGREDPCIRGRSGGYSSSQRRKSRGTGPFRELTRVRPQLRHILGLECTFDLGGRLRAVILYTVPTRDGLQRISI